jgi:hypothetical protein
MSMLCFVFRKMDVDEQWLLKNAKEESSSRVTC